MHVKIDSSNTGHGLSFTEFQVKCLFSYKSAFDFFLRKETNVIQDIDIEILSIVFCGCVYEVKKTHGIVPTRKCSVEPND